MTAIRRVVILVTVAALALVCLYPPWLGVFHTGSVQYPLAFEQELGYSWLWNPPSAFTFRGVGRGGLQRGSDAIKIGIDRLILECFAVAVMGAGIYLAVGRLKR